MLLPFWSLKNLVQCLLAYIYFFIAQLVLIEQIYLFNKFIEHISCSRYCSRFWGYKKLTKENCTQFKKWNLHSVNKILEGMLLSFSNIAPSLFLSSSLPLLSNFNILVF